MKKLIMLVMVIGLLVVSNVWAEQSERCNGSRIVSVGDHLEDVLSKCGEPDAYIPYVNRFGVEVAVELRYDQGKGTFSHFFFFNNHGVCTRIRTGAERN